MKSTRNMKDFDQLKNIWQQQETKSIPDVSTIINKAKKFRKQYNQKIIFQLISLVLAMVVVSWVVITINFKQVTTYIGIALMFICVTLFSILRYMQMQKLNKIDFTSNPNDTLNQLNYVYQFQKWVNTKITGWYFLVMSLAFGLYFIEVIAPLSITIKLTVIILTTLWMLIAYFYLGKKQIQKENNRIQTMIDTVEEIKLNYEK